MTGYLTDAFTVGRGGDLTISFGDLTYTFERCYVESVTEPPMQYADVTTRAEYGGFRQMAIPTGLREPFQIMIRGIPKGMTKGCPFELKHVDDMTVREVLRIANEKIRGG